MPTPPLPDDARGDVPEGSDEAAALVRAAQHGDADAFGLLYDQHVDLVYRFVSYRVAGQTLAEDLTSEVFLRALRRIDAFTWQGREFGAWLLTIARNLVTDHYKSARVRREVATDDLTVADLRTTSASSESVALDGLRDRAVVEAVGLLPDEQRECVSLRFLEGLSVHETAVVLGKSDGAVKALQYRAVRALARLLESDPS